MSSLAAAEPGCSTWKKCMKHNDTYIDPTWPSGHATSKCMTWHVHLRENIHVVKCRIFLRYTIPFHGNGGNGWLPSGKLTVCYWTWWFSSGISALIAWWFSIVMGQFTRGYHKNPYLWIPYLCPLLLGMTCTCLKPKPSQIRCTYLYIKIWQWKIVYIGDFPDGKPTETSSSIHIYIVFSH